MFEMFSDMPQAAKFVAAFVVVLALIGLTAWLVRRFGANRLGSTARGRQPRLAVIDAANVDGRRRLVLIRRDNVEHLMMIGGPNDVVVEPNIVRASARDSRENSRDARAPEPTMRSVPVAENGGSWPLQPAVEPPPVAPVAPRPVRGNVPEEPWVPSEPPMTAPSREPAMRETPRRDSLTGIGASEFANKMGAEFDFSGIRPAAPAPTPRAEAPAPVAPVVTPAEEAAPTPQTDRNLAEMAQRLEAALKRQNTSDYQPPVTDPLAAPVKNEPKVETRTEPKFEAPRPAAKPEFRPEAKPATPAAAAPAAQKSPFDSLEQEMANLLGRQPGKT